MQASLDKAPANKQKKHLSNPLGKVELAKNYRFEAKCNGFFISPCLHNLIALAGVSDVYSKSNDLLNAFLEITISENQVYRVTDCIGNQLTPDLMEEVAYPVLAQGQRVYASIDRSTIQMDRGWQGVKLGRILLED